MDYGRNQKTCYTQTLTGANIVVMIHPDYQYYFRIIPAFVGLVASGEYEAALCSCILVGKTAQGGIPRYKYFFNRCLTMFGSLLLGAKLSEYNTGFQAFSHKVLESLPLWENSDDFVFGNEMLAQAIYFGFPIGEVSCATRYFYEASSINLRRSIKYGLGTVATSVKFFLQKRGWFNCRIFVHKGSSLIPHFYYMNIDLPTPSDNS
jgi:hypothetical protein